MEIMELIQGLSTIHPLAWISNFALGALGLLMLYLLSDTRGEPILYILSMGITVAGCWWSMLDRTLPDTPATTMFLVGLLSVSFFLAKSTQFVTRFNIKNSLRMVSSIWSMKHIVKATNCDKIIFFVTIKQHGKLGPGCPTYAMTGRNGESGQQDEWLEYQGRELDDHAVDILETVIERGYCSVTVDEIEDPLAHPSMFDDIYRAKGIRYSEIYEIRNSRSAIMYTSVAYLQRPNNTSASRNDLTNLIQQIKNTWDI